MKIQITKIEPKYVDVSTCEGLDFLLQHYDVHFKIVHAKDVVSGIMEFDDINTTDILQSKIRRRIINNLSNAKE